MRSLLRIAWHLCICAGGLMACFLAGRPLVDRLLTVSQEIAGGQLWEVAARKRILSGLIVAGLKGPDAGRWSIQYVEGLHYLPVATVDERRESFSLVASFKPTEAEGWSFSSIVIEEQYLRFLRALHEEARRTRLAAEGRATAPRAEPSWSMNSIAATATSGDRRSAGSRATALRMLGQLSRHVERLLEGLDRPAESRELFLALDKVRRFQHGPEGGDPGSSFFTLPAMDLESGRVGAPVASYRAGSCAGSLERLSDGANDPGEGSVDRIRVEILEDVREFAIVRPWMDEPLLDKYRERLSIGGERFFGAGGPLHLIPAKLIITEGPRYLVRLDPAQSGQIASWRQEGDCCALTCEGRRRTLRRDFLISRDGVMTALDSTARPGVFAIVSRRY